MLDFATPHSTYEPVGENRGRFIVEPLARGFGYTFGNSLRRVLLSSLEGAAISSVKITGVEHEFSTVPHVKEDVTDIILNLKKVVFVLHGEADDHEVMLVKDGPGAVTAADIQLPAAVEVMDPGRLHRHPRGRRAPGDAADRASRPGLRLRRRQQAGADHPGRHPHRLHLLAGAAGGLQRRTGARGPAHRLRQADAGSGDQRGARSQDGRHQGCRPASRRPSRSSPATPTRTKTATLASRPARANSRPPRARASTTPPSRSWSWAFAPTTASSGKASRLSAISSTSPSRNSCASRTSGARA